MTESQVRSSMQHQQYKFNPTNYSNNYIPNSSSNCHHTPSSNSSQIYLDSSTEQYYTVASPRGPEAGLEVRHYQLESDHSEHREKINKQKFDQYSARFKSQLTNARQSCERTAASLKSRPQSAQHYHKSLSEKDTNNRLDSWDIYPDLKTFSEEQRDYNQGEQYQNNYRSCYQPKFQPEPEKIPNNPHRRTPEENLDINSITMSETTFAMPRLQEKQDLQTLNSRLSQYIRHIREMKENSGYLDSKVFLESVTIMEQELNNLKNMYERELDNAR